MTAEPHGYDFIIVGGGTSGLVVATRLSEDPNTKVLVIEAGANSLENPAISVPALWPSLLGSELDWSFETTRQDSLHGRTISLPQGRILGGSSALDGQAFIAPSRAGLDTWGRLGNPGWDWKSLEPYYEKCHTLRVPSRDARYHLGLEYLMEGKYLGQNGPLQTSYTGMTKENVVSKAWVDTFRSLNYGLTEDPFMGGSTGGFANPTTVDSATKERSYAASAYYEPVQNRPNLQLITSCQVIKIILAGYQDLIIATGVEVDRQGLKLVYTAQKEVILAAGTFNSPKLLELSGIGDSGLLTSLGIPIIINNPAVGENLQDHPMTGISFEVNDGVTTLDDLNRRDKEAVNAAMNAYQVSKTGPLSGGAVNSFAFMPVVDFQSANGVAALTRLLDEYSTELSTTNQKMECDFVRSVLSSSDMSSGTFLMYAAQGNFGADGSRATDVPKSFQQGNFITVAASLSYPLSRGNVHICSASTADKPTINPRYMSNALDLEIHARHLRYIETLVSTEPLKSLLKLNGRRSPDFAFIGDDLEAAKEYITRTMISGWHPVGTCAMKPLESGGVVDARLRIHGVQNLRVVDASVMPLITRGDTQATVYAVAERAADIIKEDHDIPL
ncbi:MAG: hypothetical protein Q9227_002019 [Pyrenula ochraceoflavens]